MNLLFLRRTGHGVFQMLGCLLFFILTTAPGTAAAQAGGPGLPAIAQQVRSASRTLQADAARLAPAAAAASLSPRQPATAFYFVRDQIELDLYGGSMRGARGTLLSRAGNALDRAMLVGALLDAWNVEWRLARGVLTDAQATRMVQLATRGGQLSGTALPSSTVPFDASSDIRHRNMARDHWWVQARVGGSWVDLDTTDPALEPGQTLTEAASTMPVAALPASEVQTMSMSLHYATSGTNGGVVLQWERATSDVGWRNLNLHIRRTAEGTYLPTLELGEQSHAGQPILPGGLQRVWLEIVFRQGGIEQRLVRDLFTAGSALDAFQVDLSTHAVLVLPGWVGPDYYRAVTGALWEEFASTAPTAQQRMEAERHEGAPSPAALDLVREQLPMLLGLTALTIAHVSDELALRTALLLGVRPYFERPRVYITSAHAEGGRIGWQVDLRHNGIDALPYDRVPWGATYAFHAIRGRVDSELEGTLLARMTGSPAMHAARFMAEARAQRAAIRTVHAGNVSRLRGSEYSAEAQRRMTQEAGTQGMVLLTPSRPIETGGVPTLWWWRIEPSTAALLAVNEFGVHPGLDLLSGVAAAPDTHHSAALMEQMRSAFAAAADTSMDTARGSVDMTQLVCAARCDLLDLSLGVCGGGRPGFDDVLAACLGRSGITTAALLGNQPQTCAGQTESFVCGAELFDAVSSRLITLEARQGYTGPWQDLAPVWMGNCACRP